MLRQSPSRDLRSSAPSFPSRTFRIHTAVLPLDRVLLLVSLAPPCRPEKRRYNPTLRPAPLPPPILRAARTPALHKPLPQSLPGQMARPIESGTTGQVNSPATHSSSPGPPRLHIQSACHRYAV